MVGTIDIHSLTLEELNGVISLYPWYAGARMELCLRMKDMNTLSDSLLAESALYVSSKRMLFDLSHTALKPSDEMLRKARQARVEPVKPAGQGRNVFVVGGDYFSQSQYSEVRHSDDNIFSSFAAKSGEGGWSEPDAEGMETFCTETLAQIYLEQGYFAEAKSIYSKLCLRYPEKSTYFAALIEEINKNI